MVKVKKNKFGKTLQKRVKTALRALGVDWSIIAGVALLLSLVTFLLIVSAGSRIPKQQDSSLRVATDELSSVSAQQAEPASVPPFLTGDWGLTHGEDPYPVAVSIDNNEDGRPQAGINHAPLVYEMLAEGDITRFLAIFSSQDTVARIGPVRSARPYFLPLAAEHRAVFVHSGGSPDALELLRSHTYKLINLEESSGDGRYFWRDAHRAAPHNLFTGTTELSRAVSAKETYGIRELSPWLWSELSVDTESAKKANTIVIPFSRRPAYTVTWQFDEKRGVWQRFIGDALSRMDDSGVIEVANIVVQFTDMRVLDDAGRRSIRLIGKGKALFFRDGVAIPARWEKLSADARTRFYDVAGAELAFAPGKVWISMVHPSAPVLFE